MNDVLVIGIAGGSGSGKSTLTHFIKEKFGDDVTVILHDDYYKSFEEIPFEERVKLNYDEPQAYDTDLMARDLAALKAGETVEIPIYDYAGYIRTREPRLVKPTKVVIAEGLLVLSVPELCDVFDISVFVDADADVRLIRRIRRDTAERGRTFDSVVDQYFATVKPMHEKYVEPSKKNADLVVLHGGENHVALDLLYHKIKNHIEGAVNG